MGSFKLRTKNGYDFYEVASALQKSIRRNDVVVAAFFGVELCQSGFGNYVWKRLYTISAEDCWGLITHEIDALHNGYVLVNKGAKEPKGRIFIGKAVILLCECYKSTSTTLLWTASTSPTRGCFLRSPTRGLSRWICQSRLKCRSTPTTCTHARVRRWARPGNSSSMRSTKPSLRGFPVYSTTLCHSLTFRPTAQESL